MVSTQQRPLICIATSIHPDYDARVFRHAKSVAEMGYDVDLICPWDPKNTSLPDRLRIVPFQRVTKRGARAFQIPLRMLPLLVARPYALYHFHDLDILWLMALLKIVTGRPVVYDCHENYAEEMKYRAYLPPWSRPVLAFAVKWYEQLWSSVIRDVVTVVPMQQQTFAAPRFRKVMVRNYAERSLSESRTDDFYRRPPACISIASQYIDNGALLVLDVARAVTRRKPEVKFYVTDRYSTDSSLRGRVQREISQPDLAGRVEMLPNVLPPNIMQNLNKATIGLTLGLATPSLQAGLPTKLFEYMAAGLPIVAADLPNSREVVNEAQCGLLVPPGDVEAYADAICALVDDPSTARAMGERGLASFLSRYNWESEIVRVGKLYARLLNGAPASATSQR